MKTNITIIILTLNEEKHIERCIRSVKSFAKDIFIIDSYSTDKTIEIAKSLGAKVYLNKWPGNHAIQFQWALDNCSIETRWVMKMDADEFVLSKLANEIQHKVNNLNESISGIYIKRRVYFFNKWIKHGGYYPIWLLRIWQYDKGHMEQRWMDEHIKLSSGKTIKFKNDLVDDNKNNITWWTQKHNNYATREAVDLLNHIYNFKSYDEVVPDIMGTQEQKKRWFKIKYAKLPLFIRPIIYFHWRYFIKLGFLDGKEGLIWHFLQGFWYRFLVDTKIFEIYFHAGKDKASIVAFLEKEYGIKF